MKTNRISDIVTPDRSKDVTVAVLADVLAKAAAELDEAQCLKQEADSSASVAANRVHTAKKAVTEAKKELDAKVDLLTRFC